MTSIGSNTFDGVHFGIQTNSMEGIPDFPTELQYAKRPKPYSDGAVDFQYSGVLELGQISYTVVVSADDWAAFVAKVGGTTKAYNISGRSGRTARLVKLDNKRQFVNTSIPCWTATATWEG